jgi:hypothetical protein
MDINRYFNVDFDDASRVLTITISKDDDKYNTLRAESGDPCAHPDRGWRPGFFNGR